MAPTYKIYMRLMMGTALASGLFFSASTQAACVTSGFDVTCTGTDTAGINTAARRNITVDDGATVVTAGDTFAVGFNSYVDVYGTVTSTGGYAINLNQGGTVYINETGVVNGGIRGGSNTTSVSVLGTVDNISLGWPGSGILYYETANITGTVTSSASATLTLMDGSATATFDTGRIGTQMTGFTSFDKAGLDDTWTLTGTNKLNWRILSGTLIGTTDNIGNISTFATGGTLGLNQSYNGTYTGVIAGDVATHISGGGDITFQNANTYTGTTEVSGTGTKLIVSANDRLGNVANGISLHDGGGLELSSSFNIARNITLSNGEGIIYTPGTTTTLSGTISGAGTLVASGAGTTILSGAKTYMGGTRISDDAIMRVSADDNLGDATGNIALDDGTLRWDAAFDTARNVDVGTGGATLNQQTFDTTLSGNLSGTGLLTKSGAGVMALTGTSTKTGGFSILAGTLIGDTGNLSGGNIANAGTLAFDQATTGTFSSVISGTGDLIKEGAGNLILTGVNTYSGDTIINGGRLSVNGSLTNSDTTVSAGAVIGGSGVIQGLDLFGTLAPGNSIGTVSAGNTIFQAGSIYEVEVNNALQSDLITITGTLDIDPTATVSVLATPGSYAASNLMTIITHTGARTGTFGNVTSDLAFLTPSLIYNANDVQLLLTNNNVSFGSVAKDHVQRDVAATIEELGTGNAVYDAFSGLTVTEAQKALDDASGEHYAGLTGATTESAGIIRNILLSRMQTLASGQGSATAGKALALGQSDSMAGKHPSYLEPAAGNKDLRNANNRVWVEAFGMTGKTDAQKTATRQDRDTVGTVGGIDRKINDTTSLGVFMGYEVGKVRSKTEQATSDMNNYHAGMYTTHAVNKALHLSGGVGATYHDIQSKRHVAFGGLSESPESDADGYTATAFIEAGHVMDMAPNVAVEPFVGFNATYSQINGYTEKDGGALNLKVNDMSALTPSHSVGVRAGTLVQDDEGRQLNLKGSLAWQHSYGNLKDDAQTSFVSGTASGFTTYGPGRVRDAALVGADVDAKLTENTVLYGGYSGTLSKDAQDHILRMGMSYKF